MTFKTNSNRRETSISIEDQTPISRTLLVMMENHSTLTGKVRMQIWSILCTSISCTPMHERRFSQHSKRSRRCGRYYPRQPNCAIMSKQSGDLLSFMPQFAKPSPSVPLSIQTSPRKRGGLSRVPLVWMRSEIRRGH